MLFTWIEMAGESGLLDLLRVGRHCSVNVGEGDIAHNRRRKVLVDGEGIYRSRSSTRSAWCPRPEADVNRACHVIQYEVGERHVLKPGTWSTMELNGASVDLSQDAVADCDIHRNSSAKAEDRPACAEETVGHGNVATASEQG